MGPLWGGVGTFFLAQNESRIYPNMCAKFGCGRVGKKGGVQTDRQTDRQTKKTAALYSRCEHRDDIQAMNKIQLITENLRHLVKPTKVQSNTSIQFACSETVAL